MAAQTKRKPVEDTESLLAEAYAGLAAIDSQLTDLDASRLDIDPATAVKTETELAALRKDAERRIELLKERAAGELTARQKKAQLALIERIEKRLADRDQFIADMCEHLANAVEAMKAAIAANGAAAVAWPWNGVRDNEPCLFGLFLRAGIRFELYRLSGNPFESADNRGGLDFPGSECPTPLRDLNPKSVKPLAEKAREASAYASRIMRETPLRVLPPVEPPPSPKPVEVKPAVAAPSAAVETRHEESRRSQPQYIFCVKFAHSKTGEERIEEVQFGPAECEEASHDGLGATGPMGRDIALRLATARVPPEFIFAGKPDSIWLDMNRLTESLNRD